MAVTKQQQQQQETIYFCGNSLGLLPRVTAELVQQELGVWGERGISGHFDHPYHRAWVSIDAPLLPESARLVGAASTEEVVIMNTLTVNLHLLMATFYRPTPARHKILIEGKAFPSDSYAVQSQVAAHGYTAAEAVLEVLPRPGEHCLRTEDILHFLQEQGPSIALVLLSGVQYYTGQLFAIEEITRAAQAQGCVVGWDLAHAVGNVPLALHDWNVDFACWCSYKYLNSGPGGIAGCFVHARHADRKPAFAGWWGNKEETRFQMDTTFDPLPSANRSRLSNPNVLAAVSLQGSLSLFAQTSMPALRAKSLLLTGLLEAMVDGMRSPLVTIITPRDPAQRGCQLSLLFAPGWMPRVLQALADQGVVCDERSPNVIRMAPVPMYNAFWQVVRCVRVMWEALHPQGRADPAI